MAEAPCEYDIREVLDGVWEDLLDYMDPVPVLAELKRSEVFRPSTLRDLQEKHPTTSEKISALLQLVKDADHSRYVLFKQCLAATGQQRLVEKLEAAERGENNPDVVREKPRTEEDKLFEVLREDLIEYYREKESTMSVAPLVEQHEAEITKFYVRPTMMAYNKPNAFGQKKQSDEKSGEKKSDEKTNIQSYRELLLNGNDPYRGIYVTADAGMGKTSFAKMLAVTWCEAHTSTGRLIRGTLKSHDIETVEKFDFLFLIKLRNFETSPKCNLDEMILELMKSKLQHESQYTKVFLEKVLCSKRCLIIVDGLDEWIHPQSCQSGEVIPHRRAWPGCTVLTTTRPWKLSTARLSMADIDRQVEISQLDGDTAWELESRAVEILNENQRQNGQVAANTKTKTVTDFIRSVPNKIPGHIRYIPFMLLQMICLWFGDNPIGKSLCEVYSNIIELTLTRWLVKTDFGHTECECEPSKEHENIKLKCVENNRHCQRYMPLLVKIGELAFSTLFNVIREESLLFDKKQVVLKYLSKEELKKCLDMGLLSQVKDTTSLTKVRLQLYFPHKTLQEYFCALFITINWNSANIGTMSIKQTISKKCTSVSDILEMSEVFVFVCGLNPEVYSDISRHLATIVSTNQSVIDYRNGVEKYMYSDMLWKYQHMQISCFLESTRNQHPECKIVIEDMFVGGLRYDYMEDDEKQVLKSILTSSAHTLKYLQLREVSLTNDMCSAISTLNNLHALYLAKVDVTSDSLNAVSDCISGCMSLQKLTIDFQYEPSGTDEKPGQREASMNFLLRSIETKTTLTYLSLDVDVGHQNYVLDLSRHDKLQELVLNLPLTELHINTEQLVTCKVYKMGGFSADVVSSLLAELHGTPVLETLTLEDIRNPPPRIDITALPLLTKFSLTSCDLRDSTVTLSPEMTRLETITLRRTTVNIPCCRELFLSISKLPQPITVELKYIDMTVAEWRELLFDILGKLPKSIHVEMLRCWGPSEEEWRNIFGNMKASPAFCVTCTGCKVSIFSQKNEAYITFDTVIV